MTPSRLRSCLFLVVGPLAELLGPVLLGIASLVEGAPLLDLGKGGLRSAYRRWRIGDVGDPSPLVDELHSGGRLS